MWTVFKKACKNSPISVGYVAAMLVLFGTVHNYPAFLPNDQRGPAWMLGAVRELVVIKLPELTGPFGLWNGQWWRVLVSPLHHSNGFQLLLNAALIGFLGYFLEPRMRRPAFFGLLFFAAVVALVSSYLLGEYPIGMTGAVFAMLGVLLVLSRRDDGVPAVISEQVLLIGTTLLLLSSSFGGPSGMNWIPLVGGIAALSYGWLFGQILFGRFSSIKPLRIAFVFGHLSIIPAIYFASQPTWIGRYQWYLASQENDEDRKVALLERAVDCDPSLHKAWVQLAAFQWDSGKRHLAWETILRGLNYNRSDEEILELAREIGRMLNRKPNRQRALETLNQVFREKALAWQDRLNMMTSTDSTLALDSPLRDSLKPSPPQAEADLPQTIRKRDLEAPQIDPDKDDSAAIGQQL